MSESPYGTLFHYDGPVPVPQMSGSIISTPEHPAKCTVCGEDFKTGDEVTINTMELGGRHLRCGEKGKTDAG